MEEDEPDARGASVMKNSKRLVFFFLFYLLFVVILPFYRRDC